MNTNFHTHTEHCGHACGNAIDFARKAYENDFKKLGFSDHAPFKNDSFGYRMSFSELDIYCNEVLIEKERYKNEFPILLGVEIEYLPKYASFDNYYEWLLSKKNMDYLLLGQHFFKDKFNNLLYTTNLHETNLMIDYAESCVEAMKTGYFRTLAHPDLFCINEPFGWNSDYEKACNILIEGALSTNTILEFNANGIRRGKKVYEDGERYQYPHEKFWEIVAESKAPVIIGSDSHNPNAFWDEAIKKAKSMVNRLGLNIIEDIN